MRRDRCRVAVLTLGLCVVLAGCSGGPDDVGGAAESATTAADSSADAAPSAAVPAPGLPEDEALVPASPDSRAGDLLTRLANVPQGALVGHLSMSVSGLAAFDEDVSGTCGRIDDRPVFEAALADGSLLRVEFGVDGGVSTLSAPGIRVDQVLREVELTVDRTVGVSAVLLTTGTSEPSGSLELEASCG